MVCELGCCTCHIVVIEGIDGVGAHSCHRQPATRRARGGAFLTPSPACTGKSTLVNQLQLICGAYVKVSLVEFTSERASPEVRPRDGSPGALALAARVSTLRLALPTSSQDAAEARLIARFSQHLRALRVTATHESGALLDGSLAGEVARIESDMCTGRLSGPRASEVLRLGAPPPQTQPAGGWLMALRRPHVFGSLPC
jgi:hypothetical protein